MYSSKILGTGHFLPEDKITNHDLEKMVDTNPVSYTHLRAHETREDLVCRLLLEKKKESV